MSESGPGQPGGATPKKWEWGNPQNVIAIVGIAVGLLGSVFGVALALPFGQDFLCKSVGVSCPHFKVSDAQLSISAIDFDAWCKDALQRQDVDALLDYRRRAPHVELALPTHEHFVPVLAALGAGGGDVASFPITGFAAGAMTKLSVQFG